MGIVVDSIYRQPVAVLELGLKVLSSGRDDGASEIFVCELFIVVD